jgi:hypothetical protein
MTLSIVIPDDIEVVLRQQLSDLDQAAKEACLVEFYRQGRLTHFQLASSLGLDGYSTDGVLKRHGVEDPMTLEELKREIAVFGENS